MLLVILAVTELKVLVIYYGWVSEILMFFMCLNVLWYMMCVVLCMEKL